MPPTTRTLTSARASLTALNGDTVIAAGASDTLTGSGLNSLVASANNDYLIAGTGANTLLGSSLAGNVTTLVGNGQSKLKYAGANNTLILNTSVAGGSGLDYKTDSIVGATSLRSAASSVIQTSLDKFDLSNTDNHGTGVANITRLVYTGSASATLHANNQNDSIVGGAGINSISSAGTTGQSTLDGHFSRFGNTLEGNGFSTLIGSSLNDTYIISETVTSGKITQSDKIVEANAGGIDLVSLASGNSPALFDLSSSINIENLSYSGSLSASLYGNTLNNSIRGGSGNNFLQGNGGSDTLDASASSGNNTLIGSSNAASSLIGGTGSNSFYLYNAADTFIAQDGSQNSIFSVSQKIDLSSAKGSYNTISYLGTGGGVNLTSNSLGGTKIIAGKASGATLGDGGATIGDTLIGSSTGANLFNVTSPGLRKDSIVGGTGTDTLRLTTKSTNLTDNAFTGVSSVEVLQLTSNSLVSLGVKASAAGISTIIAGTGSDTINTSAFTSRGLVIDASGNSSNHYYTGSTLNDLIKLQSAALASSTIAGGDGVDTLQVVTSGVNLTSFGSNITGLEVLSLTGGGNKVSGFASGTTLVAAGTAGGDTIDASGSSTSLRIDASKASSGETLVASSSVSTTLIGGAGNDSLSVNSLQLSGDSILGGAGTDTLLISTNASNLADVAFAGVSSVEVLQLTSNSSLSLGSNASSAGISTVVAGSLSDTINASAFTSRGLVIDASGNSSNHYYTGSTLNDLIKVQSTALETSTIAGGIGIDTLHIITSGVNLTSFGSNITGVEVLSLTGGGNKVSGFASSTTLVAAGTGGGDTIDASGSSTSLRIDASKASSGETLVASSSVSTTLIGGAGNDSLSVSSSQLFTDSIAGGAGTDTLLISTSATNLTDSTFAGVSSVEVLQLTGNSSLSLGTNASNSGISTVVAGSLSDTINASAFTTRGLVIDASANSSNHNYTGTANNDLFKVQGTALNNSTIAGGVGIDTLQVVTSGATLSSFGSNITGVEVLSLTGGGNKVSGFASGTTLVAAGTGGRDTIDASGSTTALRIDASQATSGETLVASSYASTTLIGGSGNDSLIVSTSQLSADSIVGGAGIDTLQLSTSATNLADSAFSKLTSVEVLSLTGGNNNFSIGNTARQAGISTIVAGGSGGDTISAAGFTTGSIYINAAQASGSETLIAGAGSTASTLVGSQSASNTFYLSTAANIGSDSVYGNLTQTDTLAFTSGAQTINDNALDGTRLRSIEIISLTGANNYVQLGANAQAGGISTLIGGTGPDYLSAQDVTAGNILIDGRSGIAGDTFVAGSGTTKSTLIGNNSSGVTNNFLVSGAQALANASIAGGSNSTDILKITAGGQTITDTAFTKSSGANLDALILSGGNNNISLGSAAENAFLNPSHSFSITGGALGGDTIDLSGIANIGTYVDEGKSTGKNTLVASSGGSTLIGGSSANSSNLFISNSSQILGKTSIVGGGGTDTLQIKGNAQTIKSFSRVSETEILQINGRSNSVVLNGADLAGISTVIGTGSSNSVDGSNYTQSTDSLTFDFSSSTGRDTLIGGGTGNLFEIKDRANLLNSSLTGGGIAPSDNTLQLVSGGQTLGDADFATAHFIGKLVLGTAATGNNVVLDSVAGGTTGISTIVTGSGRDTINAANLANSDNHVWIDGSRGTGDSLIGSTLGGAFNTLIGSTNGTNVFVVAGIAGNSIVGGAAGNDTLAFTSSISVDDTAFAPLSDIGALKFLQGNNTAVLGTNALIAGISTIIGGLNGDTGGDTFDASGYNNASVLFQITDQNYLSTSSIVGSAGSTTLQFTNDGISVTDADLANIRNIKVLQTANGNNRILISDNFQYSAGIATVIGGTGSDTVDITDTNLYNPTSGSSTLTYDLSRGKDGYDFVTSIANTPYSKIIGGSGKNTLEIADAGAIGDTLFANQYQAKAGSLILSDAGSNSATLAGMAGAAGISSVYLGNVGDSINATSFSGNLTINGGTGNDLVQTSMNLGSNLTLNGGHQGIDTLQVINTNGRSITSLAGSFDALAMTAGNNYIALAAESLSAGITSIYGGTGVDTISVKNFTKGIDLIVAQTALGSGSTKDSLVGGNGNDTLTIAEFPSPSSSPVINEATFARTSSIEALALNSAGGYSATFGVNALKTGISTIYGSTGGNDYFNATNFIDPNGVIKKGLKFVLPGSQQLSTDTIQGTIYNDTLALASGSQTVDDSKFANVSGIESFQLGDGGNSVALDTNAKNAGITAVIGGSGNNSITQGDNFTTTATISGGGGNDTLSITDRASLRRNSLDGGSGTNTIVFSKDGQTVTDADFGRTSSIQAIRTASGSNVVSLGSTAGARGISSLFGGTGNDSFDASALGTPTYLDGAEGNNTFIGGTTVVGGVGNDSIVVTASAASITGGGGNDLISFNSYDNVITSRLVDGGAGTDTLAIGSAVTLNDSLSHFTNIEALALASSSVVTLGNNAQSAGINQIILGTGPDTIDAKTYTAQLTLDASSYSGASSLGDSLIGGTSGTDFIFSNAGAVLNSTVKGGTGTDTLSFSSGGQNVTDSSFTFLTSVEALSLSGASNTVTVNLTAQGSGLRSITLGGAGDTFTQESPFTNALYVTGGASADNIILSTTAQLANDNISDAGGNDTLTIQQSSSFKTSDFSRVSGIEALQLTSNSSITLGGAISFESILGGSGLDTFVQTATFTKSTTVDGGAGADLFSLQSAFYLSSESLIGGNDGPDTLAIASAVSGFDDSFTGIKSMEVLSLSGANDSISLRGNATLAGIKQVLLGDGSNSVAIDSQSNFLSYSSIAGGSGTDTLSILGQVSALGDTGFSALSSIDILDISNSGAANSVTLGTIANTTAGIRTLISGSASDVVAIQSTNQLDEGYSLDGGIGTDTLSILGQVSGLNEGFGNVSSFEALSLSGADDNMTFGSADQSAGIRSISLGSGRNKISFKTQAIFGVTNVTGSSGFDTKTGAGLDTLALLDSGSPISLDDSDFSKLTSIDAISLSATGPASHVTLGSTAENNASISTIVGSSAADTITAFYYQNAITIDDSQNTSAAASLTAGSGNDLIILGGQGALTLSNIDGNGGTNTLTVVDQIAGNDTDLFSHLSHIQLLSLSGYDDTATLGENASLAGIKTIIAGGGNNNIAFATQDYFTLAAVEGGDKTDTVAILEGVNLNDAFDNLTSVEVLSLAGASNTITLAGNALNAGIQTIIGGNSNDLITFEALDRLRDSSDAVIGRDGTDTLAFSDQASGLYDSLFSHISSIEFLNLSSSLGNSVTLGSIAQDTLGANIHTVISGSGDDLINVKSQYQIEANYSVDGSTGSDTLEIQDHVSIGGNGFSSVHGIEFLALFGAANAVTLDSSASDITNPLITTGITTVVGGNSNDLIAFDTKERFSKVSVVGGSGTKDTLAIFDSVGAANFAAGDLDLISGIEVLDLSASKADNSIIIDSKALSNGINDVIGGSGEDTIDASAHTTATRLTLDGGDGAPNTLIGGLGTEFFLGHNGDSIVGGGGNDTLTTNDSVYTVNPGANIKNIFYTGSGTISLTGNNDGDALNGGSLNDIIVGGSGNDSIDGGAGADSMVGSTGDDLYFVDNIDDKVVENSSAGNDTVVANIDGYTLATNVEVLTLGSAASIKSGYGNNQGDSIFGNNHGDSLFGGTGNDTILGGTGNDTIIGGGGSDCLIGGGGTNSLVGAGAGNDTFVIRANQGLNTLYSARSYDIIVTNEDSLSTNALIVDASFSIADEPTPSIGHNAPNPYGRIKQLIYTGSSDVKLIGNAIGNTLISGSGNDALDGSAGNTSMAGGTGNDLYIWGRNDSLTESAAAGTDTIVSSTSDVILSSSDSIEWISLTGSQALTAKGSDTSSKIIGNDAVDNLYGGAGDDCLVAGSGGGLLIGGGGENTFVGGQGNDTFVLGTILNPDGSISTPDKIVNTTFGGVDEVDVAASVDLTKLNNIQKVNLLRNTLNGFQDFSLIGNDQNNTLIGNGGANYIDGGAGINLMVGGGGDDTYVVRNAADTIIAGSDITDTMGSGGGPNQVVISWLKDYTLTPSVKTLIVNGGPRSSAYGNQSANSIMGDNGGDSLYGMGGADTIIGGLGNDYLDGDYSYDDKVSMSGGQGDDTYMVGGIQNSPVELSNQGIDKIILDSYIIADVINNKGVNYLNPYNPSTFTGIHYSGIGTADGSVQVMMNYDTLISSNLNYNPFATYPNYSTSNITPISFRNLNYFYILADNFEQLDVVNKPIIIDGLISGNAQPDFIYGNSLNDTIKITGETSLEFQNNYIDGGSGIAYMAGGYGDDTYVVHNSDDKVIESSGQGTDRVNASVTYNLSQNASDNVENLTLLDVTESLSGGRPVTYTLTGAALNFNGTGNGADNIISGNSGNNALFGLGGNDTILGGGGTDYIDGGDGNDLFIALTSNLANDTFVGGAGIDSIQVSGDNLILPSLDHVTGVEVLTLSGNGAKISNLSPGLNVVLAGYFASLDASSATTSVTLSGLGFNSLTGGSADDSLISNGPFSTFDGGSGNDRIAVDATWFPLDSIDGGAGVDTLAISGGLTVLSSFTNVDNVEVLSLSGGGYDVSNLSVGINLVVGDNNGGDTFDASSASNPITLDAHAAQLADSLVASNSFSSTLLGGAGNDTFVVAAARISSDSIVGGAGADILSLTGGNILINSFTQVSGVEALYLTGGNYNISNLTSDITVVSGSSAGFDTIDASNSASPVSLDAQGASSILKGGSGNDTLTSTGTNSTLISGNGNNYISVDTQADYATDSIIGGTGTDTLAILAQVTALNDGFTNVTGVEVLDLSSSVLSNSAILGANAAATGISTLIGGAGNDTFTNYNPYTTIYGGSGDDLLISYGAHTSLNGGIGANIFISTGSNSTLVGGSGDDVFSSSGDSSTLLGGNGNNIITSSGANSWLQGGVNRDTFISSGYHSTFMGGTGSELFQINYALLADDSIIGGGGTSDTLAIQDQVSGLNDGFSKVTGVGFLDLSTSGSSNNITLGNYAETGGFATILGGIANDTIDASAYKTHNLTLDGGAGTNSLLGGDGNDSLVSSGANSKLIGGKGNDTLVSTGSNSTFDGGAGNNVFTVDSQTNYSTDSFIGSTGTDTLVIQGQVSGLYDAFTKLSSVEVLDLSISGLGNTVTLGTNAATTGITTFISGTGNDNIAFDTKAHFVADSVVGGLGTDTVFLWDPSSFNLADSELTNISSIEVLDLSNAAGNNKVILGSNAQRSGISTLIGNSGNNTFSATGANFSLLGGSGNDSLVSTGDYSTVNGGSGNNAITSSGVNSSLIAGAGNDVITSSGSNSTLFGGDGNNTLTSTGANSSIQGGTGNDTLISSGYNSTLSGGSGSELFQITSQSLLINDSISGVLGTNDTLAILGQVTGLNNSFSRVSGIEVLSLAGGVNNSVTLGGSAQAAGISTIIGGAGKDTIDASAYSASVTVQAWSGSAASNTNSDTMVAGASGADLFVMANAGDTDNAYGHGGTVTAYISGFKINADIATNDQLQLHDFGSGANDYSTSLSGNTLDIWHTGTHTASNLVAELTINDPSATPFTLQDIARFV